MAAVAWAFLFPTAGRVLAHGDLDGEIRNITERLAATPDDAFLYLRRANLHRTHEDWPAAEADYAAARKLAPDLAAVDLAHGEMLLQKGDDNGAVNRLDCALAREPRNPLTLVARGRALMAGGHPLPAAADLAAAMEIMGKDAGPDLSLEQAHALVAGGKSAEALGVLDAAISRLGPVANLVLAAVDLEVDMGRSDAALDRLDTFASHQPRKERWLALRGAILEKAGRPAEARTAYAEAQAAITRLPDARRTVALVADLQRQLQADLLRLGDPPQNPSH
jgi:tetratricopeptide (TPR) repeat protein